MASAHSLSFASALSTETSSNSAVRQVCSQALRQLAATPDLALVFMSQHHTDQASRLAEEICWRLDTDRLLGCTGESIVGVGREIELQPAMSLWLARLPRVTVLPMHLDFARTPEGGSIVGWPDDLPDPWPSGASLIVLGDPFSFPADVLLQRLNEDQPHRAVIGGMASSGHQPGENRLLLGRRTLDRGAVAVLLYGDLVVRTIVSQGCRPIGNHLVITKAERNVIHELGGRPAYERLVEVYHTLATREQAMLQKGLHLGRVVSEYQDRFEQGDFLVRNVVGVDTESGAIAVADYMRPGQTVQFHVRDAQTAGAELRQLLAAVRDDAQTLPEGALLFTCNGRGTRLFPEPHHDAAVIARSFGDIPLAGFFAAGELGPVGGRNFTHGFTASIALFERRPGNQCGTE